MMPIPADAIHNPLYAEILNLRAMNLQRVQDLENFRQRVANQLDDPQWNDDEKRAFKAVLTWLNGEKASWHN